MAFSVPAPTGSRALFWEAKLDAYGQSVDQRVKFSTWLETFAQRGGRVVYTEILNDAVPGQVKTFDSSGFKEGVYLLQVTSGENSAVRKIVIKN